MAAKKCGQNVRLHSCYTTLLMREIDLVLFTWFEVIVNITFCVYNSMRKNYMKFFNKKKNRGFLSIKGVPIAKLRSLILTSLDYLSHFAGFKKIMQSSKNNIRSKNKLRQ